MGGGDEIGWGNTSSPTTSDFTLFAKIAYGSPWGWNPFYALWYRGGNYKIKLLDFDGEGVVAWLIENNIRIDRLDHVVQIVRFSNEAMAMAFKLRWL